MTTWRIGELATATGVTVRTLHHYDGLGLLSPSERTSVGHRRYTAADVRRLHRIIALRDFGLSLAEIARVLDGPDADPRELLRAQLARVEERLTAGERLRRTLIDLIASLDQVSLDRAVEPDVHHLIALIEGTTRMNRPLTEEELAEMTETRQALMATLTPEQIAEMNETRRRWRESLTEEELTAARTARAALLPPSWQPRDG
ncbi:transcriptional regulator [Virgisporangium aliadipatigenens]|uniref:Transcriptional regulator n=1 Tax=Virgisporangium aliadipatigenens TaxID=741659 RepID=A0A8J3YWJ8_9ACTN|nr:MerR family transcriptional regulator [Virgisporangium aliadipatigenens]GIJ52007.1 transcriptional regulator [Virgisporangium aliadipatigenens]